MSLKDRFEALLLSSGFLKCTDDDDVDSYVSRTEEYRIILPEEKIHENDPAEYERLMNIAIESYAKYMSLPIDEVNAK